MARLGRETVNLEFYRCWIHVSSEMGHCISLVRQQVPTSRLAWLDWLVKQWFISQGGHGGGGSVHCDTAKKLTNTRSLHSKNVNTVNPHVLLWVNTIWIPSVMSQTPLKQYSSFQKCESTNTLNKHQCTFKTSYRPNTWLNSISDRPSFTLVSSLGLDLAMYFGQKQACGRELSPRAYAMLKIVTCDTYINGNTVAVTKVKILINL